MPDASDQNYDRDLRDLREELREVVALLREHNPDRECTLRSLSPADRTEVEEAWWRIVSCIDGTAREREVATAAIEFLIAAGLVQRKRRRGGWELNFIWREGMRPH